MRLGVGQWAIRSAKTASNVIAEEFVQYTSKVLERKQQPFQLNLILLCRLLVASRWHIPP